jgi:HAE1 family hydrophobic/amphiphilic exporter-1
MWFTRVSIHNPVMATMVMLAFVVLGLFSYQRLSIDQFPNIDIPTVVVQMDYPGASPEIVEAEVTKKIEEAVNTVAGIDTMFSRSYEGSSVVIVQFKLDIDGRKAAEDVREKVALVKPLLREEVKDARISRFDPSSQPIFNVAVLSPDGSRSAQELTTWATQVLQKRWRTCAAWARSASSAACSARSTSTCAGGAGSAGRRHRPGGGRAAQREPGTAAGRHPLKPSARAWCRSTRA